MISDSQLKEWAKMLAEPGAANHFYGYLDHKAAAELVEEVQRLRASENLLIDRRPGVAEINRKIH